MDMIMFRTSSVFMRRLLLLLIILPKFHSQEPPSPLPLPLPLPPPSPPFDFSICKEPYQCGEQNHIFYPFWGHNRPVQCGGGPLFQLNCHDDGTTTILNGSQNFTVISIHDHDHSIRLVKAEFADVTDVCSLKYEDIYVTSTKVLYRDSRVYDITVLYNCPPVPDVIYHFKCGNNFSYYGFDKKDKKLIKKLSPLCKGRLHFPTDAGLDDYAAGGDAALKNVLQIGFEVNYAVAEDCARCLGSEGDCWNDGIEKHIDSCYYCTDRSQDCTYHPKSTSNFSRKIIIGVGSAVMTGFMICLILCCRKCTSLPGHVKFWLKRTRIDHDIEAFLSEHGALAQRRYKFSEVKKMTKSFKIKLGQGGFGVVYKGELLTGCSVAVKILNASKGNGKDFINEVASISRTSHVNIVTLIGFCLEGRKKALIYEFMSNGSLDKYIYNKGFETTTSLSWDNLWQIAIGIARGLEYLHRGCNTRILHFDIKPHNILLDENFCPKISDFGLAKLCPRKESIISMSDARGTIGYVAPEVWNRHFGGISYKSDVYSYGMMLLEMVGGRKNINAEASNTSEIYFPHWVYNRLEQGEDLRPYGVIATEENEIAKKMTVVGLWCVQTFPKDRPDMSRVVDMLEDSLNSLEIPPKPVLFSPIRSVPESSTS